MERRTNRAIRGPQSLAEGGTLLARSAAANAHHGDRATPRLSAPTMSRVIRPFLCAASLALAASAASGCTTHYIPNTDVEDNDDNRKVVGFCEKYRHAV